MFPFTGFQPLPCCDIGARVLCGWCLESAETYKEDAGVEAGASLQQCQHIISVIHCRTHNIVIPQYCVSQTKYFRLGIGTVYKNENGCFLLIRLTSHHDIEQGYRLFIILDTTLSYPSRLRLLAWQSSYIWFDSDFLPSLGNSQRLTHLHKPSCRCLGAWVAGIGQKA